MTVVPKAVTRVAIRVTIVAARTGTTVRRAMTATGSAGPMRGGPTSTGIVTATIPGISITIAAISIAMTDIRIVMVRDVPRSIAMTDTVSAVTIARTSTVEIVGTSIVTTTAVARGVPISIVTTAGAAIVVTIAVVIVVTSIATIAGRKAVAVMAVIGTSIVTTAVTSIVMIAVAAIGATTVRMIAAVKAARDSMVTAGSIATIVPKTVVIAVTSIVTTVAAIVGSSAVTQARPSAGITTTVVDVAAIGVDSGEMTAISGITTDVPSSSVNRGATPTGPYPSRPRTRTRTGVRMNRECPVAWSGPCCPRMRKSV